MSRKIVVRNVVEGRNRAKLENMKKQIRAKGKRTGAKSRNAVVCHAQETAKKNRRPMIPGNPVARHAMAACSKSRRG